MSALATVTSVRLPAVYQQAVKAIESCESLDESKEWRDKAEAVAGWARIAKDESALHAAMRLAAHATRRMGELLREIPKETPGPKVGDKSGRPESIPTRAEVAESAGLSRHQTTQAIAVAAIPEKKFEKLVEAEKPATLTELARARLEASAVTTIERAWSHDRRRPHEADERLTPAQARALVVIAESVRTRGIAPTVEELCDALGICQRSPGTKKSMGHQLYTHLEQKGYLRRDRGLARANVLRRDYAVVRLRGMP